MKAFSLIISCCGLLLPFSLKSQPPIEWEYNYGGSQYESGNGIIQNAAKEFIMCSVAHSSDNDVSGNHGNSDYWLVRLDSDGVMLNQKCIGGSGYDDGRSVIPVSTGGYVFLGAGGSGDGDQSGNWGNSYDYWIVKTDESFNIIWETNLGGNDFDVPYGVTETYDGGFVIAGLSRSSDGNVSANYGEEDYWIVKVDSAGNLLWEKNFGGSDFDEARAVIELVDHSLIIAGFSSSSDGDVVTPKGNQDFWVLRLNEFGAFVWAFNYGGAATDIATALIEDITGNIMILGETGSVNGDVSFNHGYSDFWLIQINPEGLLLWEKSYGGTNLEVPTSIMQTSDSGFVMAGRSKSSDGDVSSNQGMEDYWIVKTDHDGNLEWEKAVGGSLNDGAECVIQTADTGYAVVGYTESSNGDISGNNYGIADSWVVKLHEPPVIGMKDISTDYLYKLYPNPAHNEIYLNSSIQKIKIFDLAGALILNEQNLNNKVDITEFQSGTYIAELCGRNGRVKRVKLIKY